MPRLDITRTDGVTVIHEGEPRVLFGGCNYLGLAQHPRVTAALRDAIDAFGVSSAASRETTGDAAPHQRLERTAAVFAGFGDAVALPEGYMANLAALSALAALHDRPVRTALVDVASHASVPHAAIAAGMSVEHYPICDVASASDLVKRRVGEPVAILTDGVFAPEGRRAPIRELLDLLPEDGWLVIDDCHGFGTVGARGRGSAEEAGVTHGPGEPDPRVIVTSTLAKAIGCYGGVVLGSDAFCEHLRASSTPYVCTTPVPPALAAAACESLLVHQDEPERVERLRANGSLLARALAPAGVTPDDRPLPVHVILSECSEERRRISQACERRGILLPAIRYPGGPPHPYFRVSVSSAHTQEQISMLGDALSEACAHACGGAAG
ncbi:MAG: pyridoxal phosphate-dependent aminotransferase family protein [Planctomycetota bacterium]